MLWISRLEIACHFASAFHIRFHVFCAMVQWFWVTIYCCSSFYCCNLSQLFPWFLFFIKMYPNYYFQTSSNSSKKSIFMKNVTFLLFIVKIILNPTRVALIFQMQWQCFSTEPKKFYSLKVMNNYLFKEERDKRSLNIYIK